MSSGTSRCLPHRLADAHSIRRSHQRGTAQERHCRARCGWQSACTGRRCETNLSDACAASLQSPSDTCCQVRVCAGVRVPQVESGGHGDALQAAHAADRSLPPAAGILVRRLLCQTASFSLDAADRPSQRGPPMADSLSPPSSSAATARAAATASSSAYRAGFRSLMHWFRCRTFERTI